MKFGDQVILANLDIVEKVGYMAALDEYIEFSRRNGQLYYKDQLVPRGIVDGKLNLEFEKTSYDLPKVDGIILVRGHLADTDYQEYQNLVRNWDEMLKEELRERERERAKLEQKRKSNLLDDTDSYLEIVSESHAANTANRSPGCGSSKRCTFKSSRAYRHTSATPLTISL